MTEGAAEPVDWAAVGPELLKRLRWIARAAENRRGQLMPMAVTEMTEREYRLFKECLAPASGALISIRGWANEALALAPEAAPEDAGCEPPS